MKTIFDELTFDVSTFVNMPKCTRTYLNDHGAGCLFTAFATAFGFEVRTEVLTPIFLFGRKRYNETEFLANICGLADKFDVKSSEEGVFFTRAVIDLYDNGREFEALHLIWKLIEKLPNKTGCAKMEDVVMPTACGVS